MSFLPIALLHSSGHASQVAAMGLGTVFFTHIIKAAEPFIGTIVVLVATGKIAPWYVNACLLPVVGGVAYAASKPGMGFDLSTLWAVPSLLALASTVAFAIAKVRRRPPSPPALSPPSTPRVWNNHPSLSGRERSTRGGSLDLDPSLLLPQEGAR